MQQQINNINNSSAISEINVGEIYLTVKSIGTVVGTIKEVNSDSIYLSDVKISKSGDYVFMGLKVKRDDILSLSQSISSSYEVSELSTVEIQELLCLIKHNRIQLKAGAIEALKAELDKRTAVVNEKLVKEEKENVVDQSSVVSDIIQSKILAEEDTKKVVAVEESNESVTVEVKVPEVKETVKVEEVPVKLIPQEETDAELRKQRAQLHEESEKLKKNSYSNTPGVKYDLSTLIYSQKLFGLKIKEIDLKLKGEKVSDELAYDILKFTAIMENRPVPEKPTKLTQKDEDSPALSSDDGSGGTKKKENSQRNLFKLKKGRSEKAKKANSNLGSETAVAGKRHLSAQSSSKTDDVKTPVNPKDSVAVTTKTPVKVENAEISKESVETNVENVTSTLEKKEGASATEDLLEQPISITSQTKSEIRSSIDKEIIPENDQPSVIKITSDKFKMTEELADRPIQIISSKSAGKEAVTSNDVDKKESGKVTENEISLEGYVSQKKKPISTTPTTNPYYQNKRTGSVGSSNGGGNTSDSGNGNLHKEGNRVFVKKYSSSTTKHYASTSYYDSLKEKPMTFTSSKKAAAALVKEEGNGKSSNGDNNHFKSNNSTRFINNKMEEKSSSDSTGKNDEKIIYKSGKYTGSNSSSNNS